MSYYLQLASHTKSRRVQSTALFNKIEICLPIVTGYCGPSVSVAASMVTFTELLFVDGLSINAGQNRRYCLYNIRFGEWTIRNRLRV
jgi:hypothetical protein